MRVALAPEGTRGDVFPMLALGEWLRAQGHTVRVCAPPDFAAAVAARELEHHPVGVPVQALLREKAPALIAGGRRMASESDRFLREQLGAQFRDLRVGLEGCDHVIGAGVQLAAPSLCEALGIPYRYVVYCPQVIPSRHHPPFVIERQASGPAANRVAWWLLRRVFGAVMGRRLARERALLGLGRLRDAYLHMATARPVLAADPVLAEVPDDAPLPVDRVACLHPRRGGALPPKLEAFLAAGPPPVYLGFGSMTDPDPAATTRALLEAARRAGCRAVLGRGWAGLGEGPLADDVLVVEEVDHAALFPRVAAVVHHGGAGTTTAAARAGVPQIVVPHVLDQFWWAERVRTLGVATPSLPRRRLEAVGLAERILAVLESELLALRAQELRERMDAARPEEDRLSCLLDPLPSPGR